MMVPIKLDGKPVSGVVTSNGFGLRVRVSADEFDPLGISPGRPVRLDGAGQAGTFLLTATEPEPPFVWLVLLPLVS
jgi:hypothetical protein